MMFMSASCSYLQKFTPISMMTACLRLTVCNDCGHTTNNGGKRIDWSLHLEYSSNI